jgi:hypothetical protein
MNITDVTRSRKPSPWTVLRQILLASDLTVTTLAADGDVSAAPSAPGKLVDVGGYDFTFTSRAQVNQALFLKVEAEISRSIGASCNLKSRDSPSRQL